VPEVHNGEVRETLAEHGRAERQMVILEPDKRALVATLFRHDCREVCIHVLVMTPRGYSNKKAEYLMYQEEGTAESGRVVSDMAREG
jgi:hypothetical protein